MTTRLHRELLKSPLARAGVGCTSILLLVIALLTGYSSWLRLSRARATADWKAVPGTIEKTGIEETWSSGATQFAPRVTYRFEHGSEAFTGNRIAPHDMAFGNRRKAEEAIAGYAPGGEVTVYYDPQDPTRSLLRPGAERMDYLMLGWPLLFLFFAYGFLQMLRRAREAGRAVEGGDPTGETGDAAS